MVRLGDVATVVSGSTPKTSVKEYWDGEFCWITPAEIEDTDVVISDTVRKITAKAIADTGLTQLPKGTVLLSSRAPIGKVAITGVEMYCNQGFKNLICSERIYNKFLFWFLKGRTEYLNSLGRGATFKEISKRIVEDIYVPLPPLEIQRKIAKTLDTVSEILAMRKQQLAELDNLIKSIFYDMFGDPVTNEKGWSIHKLGEVCDVRDGTHDSPNYVESGYPLVTSKNVRNGEISLDDVSYISYEDYCEINKRSKVDKGDIIMPMIGTIGNPAIVKHDAPSFAIKNVALIKFPIPSRIGNLYLKELLTLDFFTIITQKRSRGGTQKFIALGDIRNLEIPVPPINIQSGFENKVTIIESVKEKVTLALDEIQYLFDSIMSRYFY